MIGVVCLTIICAVGGILIYMERQRRDAQEATRLQQEIQADIELEQEIRGDVSIWKSEHRTKSWHQDLSLKPQLDKYKDNFYELRTKQARLREIQQGVSVMPTRDETDKDAESMLGTTEPMPTPSEKVIIPHQ